MANNMDGMYKLSFLFIIFLIFATTAESAEQWNLGLPNSFSAVNVTTVLNLTYLSQNSVPFVRAGGQITSDSANYSYYTSNGTLVLQKGILQAINVTTVANLTYLSQNSIPFIGAGGNVTQDATNFSYFTANGTLVVKNIQATAFNDTDNPSYYIDPASTGTSGVFAGSVSIGSTTPYSYKLFVVGNVVVGRHTNDGGAANEAYQLEIHSSGSATNNNYVAGIKTSSGDGVQPANSALQIFAQHWNGTAYIQPVIATFRNDGNIGIGTTSFPGGGTPVMVLAKAGSAPTGMPANTAGLYGLNNASGYTQLYAIDSAGVSTKLTTGNDTLLAQSSLPMPYFVNFFNPYIGKDVEYDVGQALADLEKTTGKKYIYLRDIPKEQWAQNENKRESEENNKSKNAVVEAWLWNNTEIEIQAPQAFETITDTKTITTDKVISTTTEYVLDETNETITPVQVPIYETKVITQTKKKIKDSVRFDRKAGKFYQKRTREEALIAVGENYVHYVKQAPPKWMADRGAN